MRKRTADEQPELISLDDKHAAERRLRDAFAAGELDEAELKRRVGRVYQAVTPRELWKASGHRAGSPVRQDGAQIRKALRLQVAIVVFAAVAMVFVLWGTAIYANGGMPDDAKVFPWQWWRQEPTTTTAP
jgi:uncharacterized protein DUF1707